MIKFILGILFTISCLYIYTENTYVAVTCDATKYSPGWYQLTGILQDMLYRNTAGLHCYKGALIKKANLGELDEEALKVLYNEYDSNLDRLNKFYTEKE